MLDEGVSYHSSTLTRYHALDQRAVGKDHDGGSISESEESIDWCEDERAAFESPASTNFHTSPSSHALQPSDTQGEREYCKKDLRRINVHLKYAKKSTRSIHQKRCSLEGTLYLQD